MNALSGENKNKLKDRIRSAKRRIKSKSSLEETIESQENRLKRDIETRLSSREEWKQSLTKDFISNTSIKDIPKDESFDFFFRNETKNENEEPKKDRIEESVIDIEEDSKDSKLLVKDMFSLATNWSLIERTSDVFITRKDRIKEENKFLYFPSDKCPEENETLISEESKVFQKFNRLITKANLNRIKNRLTTEDLYHKFCDNDMKFAKNCDRIVVNNSVTYLPEFGSEKELICRHKSSVYSIKELIERTFRGSNPFLKNEVRAEAKDDIEAKSLESLNADQLSQLLEQMKIKDNGQKDSPNKDSKRLNEEIKDENNDTDENKSRDSAKILEFCRDEDIENNPRFKLLRLRWEGVPQFKNFRFVPLNEKEIPLDLFKAKDKTKTLMNTKQKFENKREKAIEVLTKVGEQLIKQSSGTVDRPRTLEDMVVEEEVPGIT